MREGGREGGREGDIVKSGTPPPAVYNHGAPFFRVVLQDALAEGEQCSGVLGHTVVGPDKEVELSHLANRHLSTTLAGQLGGGGGGSVRVEGVRG